MPGYVNYHERSSSVRKRAVANTVDARNQQRNLKILIFSPLAGAYQDSTTNWNVDSAMSMACIQLLLPTQTRISTAVN